MRCSIFKYLLTDHYIKKKIIGYFYLNKLNIKDVAIPTMYPIMPTAKFTNNGYLKLFLKLFF